MRMVFVPGLCRLGDFLWAISGGESGSVGSICWGSRGPWIFIGLIGAVIDGSGRGGFLGEAHECVAERASRRCGIPS